MSWLRTIQTRFYALFRKQRLDTEMDQEMRLHIEMRTQQNIDHGMPPQEARYAAARQFGWMESIKETCREQRGGRWMEALLQDSRFGARQLRKNPGFTAVAVLTLALGIGACTGIFSLINAVMLRTLPFPDAGRLVAVWAGNPSLKLGLPFLPPTNSDVARWREPSDSFTRTAAFTPRTADLAGGGDPERVGAVGITAGFFETLGVMPRLGRTLAPEEELPGGSPVVFISHGLWQRRFGGDPGMVGRSISVNGEPRTVIGVLPAGFDFPRSAEWPAFFPFPAGTEVWLPLTFSAEDWVDRTQRALVMIGHLSPKATLRQAQAEMGAFAAREAKDHPDTHKGWSLKLVTFREQLAGRSQPALLILLAAVGLLLVIACVNVANLLLARGGARRQEMAVRAALGAGRGRLARQMIVECLLLAALGGGLGLLVATGCVRLFLALNPATYSSLNEASIDPRVLGFTALAVLVTCVLFGLPPVQQGSRLDLRKALYEGGRGLDGPALGRLRGGFIAAEVALALVLLTVAGLMVRSFLLVRTVQPGFRAESVLAFDLQLPDARYPGDAAKVRFFEQLTTRLEGFPGVRAVGAISYLPLGGGENLGAFAIEGEAPAASGYDRATERRWVTPGYFAALGIPIRSGRVFEPSDKAGQPLAVVINETMVRQFFDGRDPVGRRLRVGQSESASWRTIVGVVGDVRSSSLEAAPRPQLYLPNAQWTWASMTFALRAENDPLALASAVRREIKALDPLLPMDKVRTLDQVVSDSVGARRLSMALLAAFAVTALLLTMMGIYGVVAFLVGRRSREIGIRMALGAQRREVLQLVLRQGMKPVVYGTAFGLAGSLVASRLVASHLYGISPSDPSTLVSITALLATAALLACWIPARRAVRLDPMVALRTD